MVTVAPVREVDGVAFAAIGLSNMLNSGGAVLQCRLQRSAAHTSSSPVQNGSDGKPGHGLTGERTSFQSSFYSVLYMRL